MCRWFPVHSSLNFNHFLCVWCELLVYWSWLHGIFMVYVSLVHRLLFLFDVFVCVFVVHSWCIYRVLLSCINGLRTTLQISRGRVPTHVMFVFGLHSAFAGQRPPWSSNGRLAQQSMQERVLASPVLQIPSSFFLFGCPAGKGSSKYKNTSRGLATHDHRQVLIYTMPAFPPQLRGW